MSENEGVKIKGAVIRDPRDWMRTAYGPNAYKSALSKLSREQQEIIDGPILAGSWYPIDAWDRFCTAMREEARTRQGHSDVQFNLRNMREAGSATVRTVYKFLVGLMSARSVVEKAVVVLNRAYSEGQAEILSNEPGRAVVRYSNCRPDLRTNLSNNFGIAFIVVLEMNGAKGIEAQCTRDEVVDGKLIYEVTIAYRD
jgi:hypothetical protein